jgi:hypothetical protein
MRDCARELPLPIHPTVCFEVGRFALTQSSRPTLTQRCSRKWMSGHAAYALVLLEDRGQFATQKPYPSGEHLPPSQGEPPFPLDCYLSWMSRLCSRDDDREGSVLSVLILTENRAVQAVPFVPLMLSP